ncbi:RNA-binding domain-containing protein [Bifidobacterium parmae]|uniref:Transcriptional regulator n=1 Tax=Bifidobacterium parmae TaxID=361854 RepID=A0A2N5J5Z9_9BIFI|nr:RNA-binding domain-containing protein [Bifidobacterium parmae]PLS29623.1 transcriptional regulator [Bifidobacterium parmae]
MTSLHENLITEFKRDWVDGAKRTAVAFANTDGGVIYLGVEDDGTPIGVPDADESMRRATQAIADGIHPDLMGFTSVETEQMNNVPVVAVHIQRGTNRPYYLADKGIRPAGVYVRSGAASIPASESAIVDMIRQTAGDSFEDAVSLQQTLTFTAAELAFSDTGLAFTEATQRTLGLRTDDGRYTNLAWLLSDQCTVSIKAAAFADDDKETFLNRQEFSGSLLTQFDQVNEFINRHNTVVSRTGDDMRRVDDYDYTPLVLREALLNLIVHRDYGLSGPSLVSVFADRMEFLNLGGLPSRFTREDMMNGISAQRNPKLANVFYRLRLVEAYGTGIRRIMGDYRDSKEQPSFHITDHTFRLVLPKHAASRATAHGHDTAASHDTEQPLSPNEHMVLDYARNHGAVTRRQAQALTGLSQGSAYQIIASLVGRGMLSRTGKARATRYMPA